MNEFPSVVSALQEERILRYFAAAQKDLNKAFEYYLWNCALCESFHFALHCAEIVCRNAIHRAVMGRFGAMWFQDALFLKILNARFMAELAQVLAEETSQHGNQVTGHHIVSATTFGFWEHLATKRFDRLLWSKGIRSVFPNAPNTVTREDVRSLIEDVRRWRNRIAHHRAIFDKGPMRKHQAALRLIELACGETYAWVANNSRVPVAISLRPC